jgi:hypothetical protein
MQTEARNVACGGRYNRGLRTVSHFYHTTRNQTWQSWMLIDAITPIFLSIPPEGGIRSFGE